MVVKVMFLQLDLNQYARQCTWANPVMVVPVKGHYEQSCNAIDACNAGAGISSNTFDLSGFLRFLNKFSSKQDEFRKWAANAEYQFLNALVLRNKEVGVRKDRPLGQPRLILPQHAH